MEEKVGIFKRLGIAITKPQEYSKLANQSILNTIGTFFVVSLVQVIVVMIFVILLINAIISVGDEVIPNIPEFTISNGELTLQDNTPKITTEAETLFILDSNILLEEVQEVYSNDVFSAIQYIAIAKDGVALKQGDTIDRIYFTEVIKEDLSKNTLIEMYDTWIKGFIKNVFLITLFIFLFLLIFIGKILGGIIFGLLGFIISKIQNKNISFKKLFNIAMYAGVLPTLLFILGGFMFSFIPMWIGFKWVIISIYIIVAVKHIQNDEEKNDNITFEIKD